MNNNLKRIPHRVLPPHNQRKFYSYRNPLKHEDCISTSLLVTAFVLAVIAAAIADGLLS